MSQEGISRRRFLQFLPVAAAAAGMLISGNDEAAARSIEDAPTGNYSESSLTCLARIDRVERFYHVNYTNGEPWTTKEIQADCTAYNGFGQEFALHLYYCFNDEKEAIGKRPRGYWRGCWPRVGGSSGCRYRGAWPSSGMETRLRCTMPGFAHTEGCS